MAILRLEARLALGVGRSWGVQVVNCRLNEQWGREVLAVRDGEGKN